MLTKYSSWNVTRYEGTRRKNYLSFDVALTLPGLDVVVDELTIADEMLAITEIAVAVVTMPSGVGVRGARTRVMRLSGESGDEFLGKFGKDGTKIFGLDESCIGGRRTRRLQGRDCGL
jgi:hypothetical protein